MKIKCSSKFINLENQKKNLENKIFVVEETETFGECVAYLIEDCNGDQFWVDEFDCSVLKGGNNGVKGG